MEPGDLIDYTGAAHRAAGVEPVDIEGRFKALEQRDVDGEKRWLVEDVRASEFRRAASDDAPFDEDVHRYLLPADYVEPAAAPAAAEDRPAE